MERIKEDTIALVVFSTTKGHWGNRTVYKKTIDFFQQELPLCFFDERIVHIKNSYEVENNKAISQEMEDFFNCFGQTNDYFKRIVTNGEWRHFSPTHALEYLKDVRTVSKNIIKSNYVLWLEDDWVFLPQKQKKLRDFILSGIQELKENNDLLTVRFPYHRNDKELFAGTEQINTKYNKLNINGSLYSFNPNLARTRDMYMISSLILSQKLFKINQVQNCEHAYSFVSKIISENPKPFAAFLPEDIRVEHIGTKNHEEIVEKLKSKEIT